MSSQQHGLNRCLSCRSNVNVQNVEGVNAFSERLERAFKTVNTLSRGRVHKRSERGARERVQ